MCKSLDYWPDDCSLLAESASEYIYGQLRAVCGLVTGLFVTKQVHRKYMGTDRSLNRMSIDDYDSRCRDLCSARIKIDILTKDHKFRYLNKNIL